jgi:hypothetical protein
MKKKNLKTGDIPGAYFHGAGSMRFLFSLKEEK